MTLPPNLDVYISAAMFVLGAYVIAFYVGLVVWTLGDIRARSRDLLAQIMATFLVALFTVPGLFVYLLLRPHETLAEEYQRSLTEQAIIQELEERRVCPDCKHSVEPDFIVCPYCHCQLRLRCVACGRLLNPNWDVCPYCGLFRDQEISEEEVGEKELDIHYDEETHPIEGDKVAEKVTVPVPSAASSTAEEEPALKNVEEIAFSEVGEEASPGDQPLHKDRDEPESEGDIPEEDENLLQDSVVLEDHEETDASLV